LFKTGVILPP